MPMIPALGNNSFAGVCKQSTYLPVSRRYSTVMYLLPTVFEKSHLPVNVCNCRAGRAKLF